jgi:N-acylneuraminate cytidylyltransferase
MDSMVNPRLEVLAIIPARGGSKGIPRKNIKLFAGFPLISYSIQAALNSKYVTRVIVSTDDEEIATVARQYGAEVPFLRPKKFAQDDTLDLPVFEHALLTLAKTENYQPDLVVQLRPTSPIRPVDLLDDAIGLMMDHPEIDSVRGVVPSGQNPHKMWRVDQTTGLMKGLIPVEGIAEPYNAPRQKLPETFWQTGHIDVIRPTVILEQHSMSGKRIKPIFINPDFTVDLDKPADWKRAEWLVWYGGLEMVIPGNKRRPLPETVELVVFDFDGVMTNNWVTVDQNGIEAVTANRGDGMGIGLLHKRGIKTLVLSTEINPVVSARCQKLKIPVIQGVEDKPVVLKEYLSNNQIKPEFVVYVGNDINDVPCFPVVGCAVAVADAHFSALSQADLILSRKGGKGAVRELCDLLLQD